MALTHKAAAQVLDVYVTLRAGELVPMCHIYLHDKVFDSHTARPRVPWSYSGRKHAKLFHVHPRDAIEHGPKPRRGVMDVFAEVPPYLERISFGALVGLR